jgi:hypothetical protein
MPNANESISLIVFILIIMQPKKYNDLLIENIVLLNDTLIIIRVERKKKLLQFSLARRFLNNDKKSISYNQEKLLFSNLHLKNNKTTFYR